MKLRYGGISLMQQFLKKLQTGEAFHFAKEIFVVDRFFLIVSRPFLSFHR